ncbi:MAG: hypothetical protein OER98_15380 [Gammaproteobacteria bacterium]|nr:hypothetical protein [Gammaproteobacteria bacterium]
MVSSAACTICRCPLSQVINSTAFKLANALGTAVIGLHASTWSLRSGPYHSLDLCVDKFAEAAQRFRGKSPQELRWGTRIEAPGVMDLVETDAVIERLDFAVERL